MIMMRGMRLETMGGCLPLGGGIEREILHLIAKPQLYDAIRHSPLASLCPSKNVVRPVRQ